MCDLQMNDSSEDRLCYSSMFRRLIYVFVIAAVSAAFLQPSVSALAYKPRSKATGIKGKVVLTGNCPGPQRKGETCPSRPYKGEIAVRRASDQKIVATKTTDSKGQFSIAVAPGKYFITQAGEAKYPIIHSLEITVVKNKFTTVEIQGDLGMR